MGFNEKTHAFIAAKFYEYLVENFGDRGEKAFIHGTQNYAQQRGRRMAQRAIRDGEELNYETYIKYGEWIPTKEITEAGQSNQSKIKALAPDFETHIHRCPWHKQFQEMGLTEAGHVYCQHLDNSIARGFNPYIDFKVLQTLHKSDYCIHIIADTHYKEVPDMNKKTEYLKSFEYHCAHSYYAYSEISSAIFASQGEKINIKVLEDFSKEFSPEMADRITTYKYTNFNIC